MSMRKSSSLGLVGVLLLAAGCGGQPSVSPPPTHHVGHAVHKKQSTVSSKTGNPPLSIEDGGTGFPGGNPTGGPAQLPVLPTSSVASTEVPVVTVPTSYASTPSTSLGTPQTVSLPIPQPIVQQMAAYLVVLNNGQSLTILGPRGLKGTAMVAEDSSFEVDLFSAQVDIQVFSDGYCIGCSAIGGRPFFAAARKDAEAYGDYGGPVLPALGASSERLLNPSTLLYSYFTERDRQLIGLASYNPNEPFGLGGAFYVVTFAGPESDADIGSYTIAHALTTLSP